MLAHVLSDLGSLTALVVSGYGNIDELTTTGPNTVSYLKDGTVTTYEFDPGRLRLQRREHLRTARR